MSDNQIEKAIKNAAHSAAIEGFDIDPTVRQWCRRLMKKEITLNEYISLVRNHAGENGNGLQY